MKLTPAETFVDCMFGRLPMGSNPIDQAERSARIKSIRQIQANAIRWASQPEVALPELLCQANQLDPLPEPFPDKNLQAIRQSND